MIQMTLMSRRPGFGRSPIGPALPSINTEDGRHNCLPSSQSGALVLRRPSYPSAAQISDTNDGTRRARTLVKTPFPLRPSPAKPILRFDYFPSHGASLPGASAADATVGRFWKEDTLPVLDQLSPMGPPVAAGRALGGLLMLSWRRLRGCAHRAALGRHPAAAPKRRPIICYVGGALAHLAYRRSPTAVPADEITCGSVPRVRTCLPGAEYSPDGLSLPTRSADRGHGAPRHSRDAAICATNLRSRLSVVRLPVPLATGIGGWVG